MNAEGFRELANNADGRSHSVRMALLEAAILHEEFKGALADVERLKARVAELEASNSGNLLALQSKNCEIIDLRDYMRGCSEMIGGDGLLAAKVNLLLVEHEKTKSDAKRYLWLRDHRGWPINENPGGAALDTAIDAAIAAETHT